MQFIDLLHYLFLYDKILKVLMPRNFYADFLYLLWSGMFFDRMIIGGLEINDILKCHSSNLWPTNVMKENYD